MSVNIYVHGACFGAPGPGGWGVVLVSGDHRKELSGSEWMTSGNRMDLTSAIYGLMALKRACSVTIRSDSQYLVRGMNAWLSAWKRRGWRTGEGDPVKNEDLWREIEALSSRHRAVWEWAHSGDRRAEDERAAALADLAVESLTGLPSRKTVTPNRPAKSPSQLTLLA